MAILLLDRVDGQVQIVAGGLNDRVAVVREDGSQLLGEVGWVGNVRPSCRSRTIAAEHAVVAASPPAVQARIVVAGVVAVTQVPENGSVVLGLQDPSQGVGQEQTIDQAGCLIRRIEGY